MTDTIRTDLDDGVLVVTLDRPARKNAFDGALWDGAVVVAALVLVAQDVGAVRSASSRMARWMPAKPATG